MDTWLDGVENKDITELGEPYLLLLRRTLCYWVTAMSLPRAMACIHPSPPLFGVVVCMYTLEGLALMYELGQRTVTRSQSRMAAITSFVMAFAIYYCGYSV
jgi:hypothetical protein